MKGFWDTDVLIENEVELPKVAKAINPIVDVFYEVRDIHTAVEGSILDISAKLVITTVYKAVDHTIRWNEQMVPVSATRIIEKSDEYDTFSECAEIRQFTGKFTQANLYKQQIFICFLTYKGPEKAAPSDDCKQVDCREEENHLKKNKKVKNKLIKELLLSKEQASSSGLLVDIDEVIDENNQA